MIYIETFPLNRILLLIYVRRFQKILDTFFQNNEKDFNNYP
jgi:hypothetical protein